MRRLKLQRNFYTEYIPRRSVSRKLYPGAIIEVLAGPIIIPRETRYVTTREIVWIVISEGGIGFIRHWFDDEKIIFEDL